MIDFLPKIEVKIAKNIAKTANSLSFLQNRKICLVSDKNIWRNCRRFFADDFLKNISEILILENAKPDEKNILQIKTAAKNCDLILALGSGVISDLCKYASFQTKIPYVIFASAPSMNGYLSRNASLLVCGHKKTLSATLPLAVYVDLEILKSAPSQMIKAGIGDSLCFYGCWFDWMLSHLILGTKFDEKPFALLAKKMDFFVKNYQKFNLRDEKLLQILTEILLLSGAGMTMAGGSYPASQSEHLIAHAFDMAHKNNKLHGLQIAITSLTSYALQKNLLQLDQLKLKKENFPQKRIEKIFGKEIALECKKEYEAKINFNFEKINKRLESDWTKHQAILKKIILPQKNLKNILQHFKIAISYRGLGLKKEEYFQLVSGAKFIRNRFTCLDATNLL